MSPRSSQRVDRRRRVLVDETRSDDSAARPRIFRGDDEGPLSRYNDQALQALDAPIARYIPFRPYSLVVWFLTGLIPIMGLMLLDQRRFEVAQYLGPDALRVFDLDAYGSLASWASGMAFAAAAVVMLAIYSVRRHRRDDYRARFTIWQWVLVIALFASIDSVVGLHGLIQAAADRLVGPLAWGNGSAWWVLVWMTLITVTMIRLAIEMSSCRKAIGWGIAASVGYFWCALVHMDVAQLNEQNWSQASRMPMLLLAHHFMLFGLVTYARHVVREAMGLTPVAVEEKPKKKQPKARKEKATKSPKPAEQKAEPVDKASPASEKPKLRTVSADDEVTPKQGAASTSSNAKPPEMNVVAADSEEPTAKLSRAERRRLKKERKRRKAA